MLVIAQKNHLYALNAALQTPALYKVEFLEKF